MNQKIVGAAIEMTRKGATFGKLNSKVLFR